MAPSLVCTNCDGRISIGTPLSPLPNDSLLATSPGITYFELTSQLSNGVVARGHVDLLTTRESGRRKRQLAEAIEVREDGLVGIEFAGIDARACLRTASCRRPSNGKLSVVGVEGLRVDRGTLSKRKALETKGLRGTRLSCLQCQGSWGGSAESSECECECAVHLVDGYGGFVDVVGHAVSVVEGCGGLWRYCWAVEAV